MPIMQQVDGSRIYPSAAALAEYREAMTYEQTMIKVTCVMAGIIAAVGIIWFLNAKTRIIGWLEDWILPLLILGAVVAFALFVVL